MNNVPSSMQLPATKLRYRFVSVHRIVGLSALPEGKDLPLRLDYPGAQATLTLDPNPPLAPIDRGTALGYLMLMGFQGHSAGPDILLAVEGLREERARERLERFPAAVFLVIEARGTVTSIPADAARDLKDAILAFDAVDKEALKRTHQPLANAALTAMVLTLNTSSDVAAVLDGVELALPDGRPLYSFTARMGAARLSVARPATANDVQVFQQTVSKLLNDVRLASPTRLWVDALKSSGDRLVAFILAWAALEMLVRKYTGNCERGEWISAVPQDDRAAAAALHQAFKEADHRSYSLAERVRAFAWMHGFADGDALAAEVTRLRTAHREPLYHEGIILEETLPTDAVTALTRRLLTAVLK